jgi:hypothetical protein
MIAMAMGRLVVLVNEDGPGRAAWVCGACGRTVETGSALEEELDVETHGGPARVE